jgi:hypothetical protein
MTAGSHGGWRFVNKLILGKLWQPSGQWDVEHYGRGKCVSWMRRDAVMVALMHEALNAPNQARRIAARLLLDLVRADAVKVGQKVAEAKATPEVVRELHALIAEHDLGGGSDH